MDIIDQDGSLVTTTTAQASVVEALNRAEVDVQITTAKRFPRDVVKAKNRMIAAVCSSVETAQECWYSVPRGGKYIEGPSVRLAEIIAIQYGNIRVVTRPAVIDDRNVMVEWAAHDLESNYATSGSVSIPIVYSKKGARAGQRYDDDQINVTCLAATSKARRNGIFAIVPGVITKELIDAAKKLATGGDRPIEAKRDLAMTYFRKMGISDERILAAVSRTAIEQLTEDDLANLRGLSNAIREGDMTIDSAFPPINPPKSASDKASELAEKLTADDMPTPKAPRKPAAPKAQPEAEPEPAAEEPEGFRPEVQEAIATMVQRYGVTDDAAIARLDEFSAKLYHQPLNRMSEEKAKDLLANVNNGTIKPRK